MREKWRYRKISLCMVQLLLGCSILGCSDAAWEKEKALEAASGAQLVWTESQAEDKGDSEEILKLCQEFYKKAEKEHKRADLETIRSMINLIGENGYPAVDDKNQVDMTEPEQVMGFCESVEAQKEAEITIFEISSLGGLVKYDLHTKDGAVDVVRSYYTYENEKLKKVGTASYQAEEWKYTGEGYLMFSGVCILEDVYTLTLSETREYTALRVQPLDEVYRELCRKYLLPIGFAQNNMFLTDWSEEDFGDLNFYDLYDIFYPKVNGRQLPYVADGDLTVSTVYQIPKEEFESVIMKYFKIDSKTLRSKTVYDPRQMTYKYSPRGFEEAEYPEYPYSEVVDFTENTDGTITLIANVVFPYAGNSKVYSHEVVVRPLEEGGVQYVSNRRLPSKEDAAETWHTPRLIEQDSDMLLLEEEKELLQNRALTAAESVSEIYQKAAVTDAANAFSAIGEFSGKWRKAVVEQLGAAGFVSVEADTPMQNHEAVETFYANYLNGQEGSVTVFEVHKNGQLGAVTFVCQKGKAQTYYIGIGMEEGGTPIIQETSVNDIAEIKLTEKGYFIYTYEEGIAHAGLRQYWRIRPLPQDCWELTQKYIAGLSYVNYNLLVTDWDSSNAEDILMPCMYEDIYRIATGKNLKIVDGRIEAEKYERIMTTYLPVSEEQVRERCGYDKSSNSYEYEMIFSRQYPPFGEVVDYRKNTDGTLTLMVDGVWPDYNSDLAFRNTIVVLPFTDGTFRYLSNSIEKMELEIP